jgi:hypothetical protein
MGKTSVRKVDAFFQEALKLGLIRFKTDADKAEAVKTDNATFIRTTTVESLEALLTTSAAAKISIPDLRHFLEEARKAGLVAFGTNADRELFEKRAADEGKPAEEVSDRELPGTLLAKPEEHTVKPGFGAARALTGVTEVVLGRSVIAIDNFLRYAGEIFAVLVAIFKEPARDRNDYLNGLAPELAKVSGMTTDEVMNKFDERTAWLFSENVTFGKGLGAYLPKLAMAGIKVAVIANPDKDVQERLIMELNAKLPEGRKIVYGDSFASVRNILNREGVVRYCYFKVEGDPAIDERNVTTFDITAIVEFIIKTIRSVSDITRAIDIEITKKARQIFMAAA